MQVNDAPSAPGPSPRENPRSARETTEPDKRARSGRHFRNALERTHDGTAWGAQEAASAAALTGWFRAESGAPPATRAPAVAAASGARAVERVLIGSGPDGAQARIHIGAGALAGTEIQLTTGAMAHAVEVRLLTHAASSRQTLSVVMDEIRSRLQNKGIALTTRAAPRAIAEAGDREGGGGEGGRPGGDRAGSGR
jgi:hypothetical protein